MPPLCDMCPIFQVRMYQKLKQNNENQSSSAACTSAEDETLFALKKVCEYSEFELNGRTSNFRGRNQADKKRIHRPIEYRRDALDRAIS